MEPLSIYIIVLLSGILLGIGMGTRLAAGQIRLQERPAYREPVYVERHGRETSLSGIVAAAIFVVVLLAFISWGNFAESSEAPSLPQQEQTALTR
jgi:hypothetical protein